MKNKPTHYSIEPQDVIAGDEVFQIYLGWSKVDEVKDNCLRCEAFGKGWYCRLYNYAFRRPMEVQE